MKKASILVLLISMLLLNANMAFAAESNIPTSTQQNQSSVENTSQETENPGITDSAPTSESTNDLETPVEECNHQWTMWKVAIEPECTEVGQEYRKCVLCEQCEFRDVPALGHDWKLVKTVKSTAFKEGKKTWSCSRCSASKTTKISKRKMTSTEKKLKSVTDKYLNGAKYYNCSKMDSCFASTKSSDDYIYIPKINKFFKKYNKKIKWHITGMKKEGKGYKVTVSVTRPDFYKISYSTFLKTYNWALNKWSDKMFDHPNAFVNKFTKLFSKKVNTCDITTDTKTVTFHMVKKNGHWKIKKKNRTMVDIANGYFWKSLEDATYDFIYSLL